MPHSTVGTTVVELAGLLPAGAFGITQLVAMLWLAQREVQLSGLRTAVRRGVHEIRRPLQLMMIERTSESSPGTGALDLAAAVCSDLESATTSRLRRSQAAPRVEHLGPASPVKVILSSALDRWSPVCDMVGRSIRVAGAAGGSKIPSIPLSQALDNLIANAITHGSGPITLVARSNGTRFEIDVRDEGPRPSRSAGKIHSPRHGHGLAATHSYLSDLNGALRFRASDRGTTATIIVPMDKGPA